MAVANDAVPLFYTRTNIRVIRSSVNEPLPLPWQEKTEIASVTRDLIFDVEVRDGSTFYNQQGWINVGRLGENTGLLLTFGAPIVAPIVPAAQYAPLDILMLNDEGKILQILPKLVLSELSEEIYPENPISAFLIIDGGSSESLSIVPGDTIEYKLFKKPPVVLQ